MTTETETVERIRELVESAIKDHCSGADLYMASKIGAEKIAAAHAREVGELEKYKADTQQLRDILGDSPAAKLVIELDQLRQANIAYSSENANLRGRAMAAEKDAARLDWLDSQRGDDVERGPYGEPQLRCHYWTIGGQCHDVRTAIDTAMGVPVREVIT